MAAQEWRRGLGFGSLRARIFAVNIVAVLVLAIMLLYLDTVRARLLEERTTGLAMEAATIAGFTEDLPWRARGAAIATKSFSRGARLRLYAADGRLLADNWGSPTVHRFQVADPAVDGWRRRSARFIDRSIETLTSFRALALYREAAADTASQWPEVTAAHARRGAATALRRSLDGDFIVAAAAPLSGGATIHLTDNAADVTRILRAERLTSFWLLVGVIAITLFLSFYLAQTIVRPLRMLAVAAHRVRLGRSREVVVPRLPDRRDEIGALARAISDMSIALRHRIDATEAFAADVAHELKNPLASLRSAVDTLETVKQPALRDRLLAVIRDDVARIDRLITDISDASRLDAELSRTGFSRLDIGQLAAGLVAAYRTSGLPAGLRLDYSAPEAGAAPVQGDAARLAQVLRNLIDNAVSFSPSPGQVLVSTDTAPGRVFVRVADQGPGVPPENRGDVFKRFYSQRPEAEDFGRHSGLGLAIAAAIVEAHGGSIDVGERPGGGAVFTVELPAG
ncbi:hypothetical protein IP88_15620 [alpha proteobacterium AAP81b]|nr:hypothetical protein IP88_15620 [alpha proteobacterium AAP81b]